MHPFKAIGLKLISALLFAAMSALVRKLGDVAPVGQMVFFRSAFAIPVIVIYAIRGELGSAVRTGRPLGQLGRGTLSVAGMFTNFSALTRRSPTQQRFPSRRRSSLSRSLLWF